MQNIKDPDQKIQMTKHLRSTPSALPILPCTPFIKVVFKGRNAGAWSIASSLHATEGNAKLIPWWKVTSGDGLLGVLHQNLLLRALIFFLIF